MFNLTGQSYPMADFVGVKEVVVDNIVSICERRLIK